MSSFTQEEIDAQNEVKYAQTRVEVLEKWEKKCAAEEKLDAAKKEFAAAKEELDAAEERFAEASAQQELDTAKERFAEASAQQESANLRYQELATIHAEACARLVLLE